LFVVCLVRVKGQPFLFLCFFAAVTGLLRSLPFSFFSSSFGVLFLSSLGSLPNMVAHKMLIVDAPVGPCARAVKKSEVSKFGGNRRE